ncbi:hypothetical protein AAC387_Pa04g2235 [Persea americana]
MYPNSFILEGLWPLSHGYKTGKAKNMEMEALNVTIKLLEKAKEWVLDFHRLSPTDNYPFVNLFLCEFFAHEVDRKLQRPVPFLPRCKTPTVSIKNVVGASIIRWATCGDWFGTVRGLLQLSSIDFCGPTSIVTFGA